MNTCQDLNEGKISSRLCCCEPQQRPSAIGDNCVDFGIRRRRTPLPESSTVTESNAENTHANEPSVAIQTPRQLRPASLGPLSRDIEPISLLPTTSRFGLVDSYASDRYVAAAVGFPRTANPVNVTNFSRNLDIPLVRLPSLHNLPSNGVGSNSQRRIMRSAWRSSKTYRNR